MRGIGHELALHPLRALHFPHHPLESVEHGIEAPREGGQLVASTDADPLREVAGVGDALRHPAQPSKRNERATRHCRPGQRSRHDADDGECDGRTEELVEDVLLGCERMRDL